MADELKTEEEIKKEEIAPQKQKAANYFADHGRRKEAVARVRLFKGKGLLEINGMPAQQYFPGIAAKSKYTKPFALTKSEGLYFATIKVNGSGKSSQLDAVVHALSRSLIKADPEFRPILKKAGLLTRDPRVKERRKYGRAQKARKGKQSPKR